MADTDTQSSGTTTPATVTAIAPTLMVCVDGATVSCPAARLNGATFTVNQRVQVTLRNPVMPLIQGQPDGGVTPDP